MELSGILFNCLRNIVSKMKQTTKNKKGIKEKVETIIFLILQKVTSKEMIKLIAKKERRKEREQEKDMTLYEPSKEKPSHP